MNSINPFIDKLKSVPDGDIVIRTFEKGKTFIHKGADTAVVMIVSGNCEVFINDDDGNEVVLGTCGPGETLGDISNVSGTTATASVRSTNEVEAIVIPRDDFFRLWDTYPESIRSLYKQSCLRLSSTNLKLADKVNQLLELRASLETKVDEQTESLRKQKKELEDQNKVLIEAMSTRDQFINMAVHDLRNPLGILKSYLELISTNEVSKDDQQQIIDILSRNTRNMLSLVNDLLRVGKINHHQMTLNKEDLDLKALINDVVMGQSIIAKKKDLDFKVSLKAISNPCYADERRLTEVLNNLISNAIKYTPRGKAIELRVTEKSDHFFFEVQDWGLGIPEEDLPKLFKSFERISTKPTEGESSTGLGLSIVKKLIEMHGGSVGVESQVGFGSTFSFSLPKTFD
jgi:signal transduction histidine kinase